MESDRNPFPVTFPDDDGSVVVNFGILTGREATQAELDKLARALHQAGAEDGMTIAAVRRQDYGHGFESVAHQVHVTVPDSPTPWVEAICGAWAVSCAEDRSIAEIPP